jgi:hypothetical protein
MQTRLSYDRGIKRNDCIHFLFCRYIFILHVASGEVIVLHVAWNHYSINTYNLPLEIYFLLHCYHNHCLHGMHMFRGHSSSDLIFLGLIQLLQSRQALSNGTGMEVLTEQNKRLVLYFDPVFL